MRAILAAGLVLLSLGDPFAARAVTLTPGDFVLLTPPRGGIDRLLVLDAALSTSTLIAEGGLLVDGTDLVVRSSGDVLVTTPASGVVRVDPVSGAQSVLASLAVLGAGRPSGITVGPTGVLHVSMQGTDPRVIEMPGDGATVRTVTSAGFLTKPAGLCFGTDGELYVCQTIDYPLSGGGGIVRVDVATGAQVAIASNAMLKGPFHIAAAPDGTLWTVQFGGLSQRRGACVVRTRASDGYSEVMPAFDCTAYGIAIRSDGTTLVGECERISGDCYGDYYVTSSVGGQRMWGSSGPLAVVPVFTVPARPASWGRLKVLYR